MFEFWTILFSITQRSERFQILKHFTSHFKHGAAYEATVLKVDEENDRLELSLIGETIILLLLCNVTI